MATHNDTLRCLSRAVYPRVGSLPGARTLLPTGLHRAPKRNRTSQVGGCAMCGWLFARQCCILTTTQILSQCAMVEVHAASSPCHIGGRSSMSRKFNDGHSNKPTRHWLPANSTQETRILLVGGHATEPLPNLAVWLRCAVPAKREWCSKRLALHGTMASSKRRASSLFRGTKSKFFTITFVVTRALASRQQRFPQRMPGNSVQIACQ